MHHDTRAVHGGRAATKASGAHIPPIDLSTTYPLPNAADGADALGAMAAGERAGKRTPVYARLHNPTVGAFEDGLANIEKAEACVAFSSGMAAITALILATRGPNSNVVALRPLYGGTDHLLQAEILGVSVKWATMDTLAHVMDENTTLVMAETPANPTTKLIDIAKVVEIAGEIPVAIDGTFAPPPIQFPLQHGAAYSLHSATKFIGGHGDVVAGVISCSEERAGVLRQVRILTGSILHPMGAFLLHRGLQTLPLRVERAQSNALELLKRLQTHPAIEAVHHPSLHPDAELIARQMSGTGSLIGINVKGGKQAAAKVMELTHLFLSAVSLGAVDSLIQHPASLTHQLVEEDVKDELGIAANFLRLSIGIENVEDLWADLKAALDVVSGNYALTEPNLQKVHSRAGNRSAVTMETQTAS